MLSGPTLPTLPLSSGRISGETREETTPRSTPYKDGSSPGEQQVQNKSLLRPGLDPETSQPQRNSQPLDRTGLVQLSAIDAFSRDARN